MSPDTVQIVPMQALSAEHRALWRAFAETDPLQGSPFMSLEFADAVAEVRPDVRVAVISGPAGRTDGFFAFHRRPGGFLRPLGAPISDWQGPVLRPGASVNMRALVSACGGHVARFTGISADAAHMAAFAQKPVPSWYIDLARGEPAYRAALKLREGKSLANAARCARKAEREIGLVRLCYQEPDASVFKTVLAWKRQRFMATGKHDIFSARWIWELFDRLYRSTNPHFGLVFSSLYFGDRLAAGEIYLRQGSRLHAWMAAYDRDLLTFGPGHILTDYFLPVAAQAGVSRLDFGPGNDDYKSKWCLQSDPIAEAVIYGLSALGGLRAAAFESWRRASPALGGANDILKRVRGRADHVCATHGHWAGVAAALAGSMIGRRTGAI